MASIARAAGYYRTAVVSNPEDLVDRAAALGYPALALADRDQERAKAFDESTPMAHRVRAAYDRLRARGPSLRERGVDFVDAALCALTAQYVARGTYKAYGEEKDGFIVVPSLTSSFSLNS